jgi:hypothetical protein
MSGITTEVLQILCCQYTEFALSILRWEHFYVTNVTGVLALNDMRGCEVEILERGHGLSHGIILELAECTE